MLFSSFSNSPKKFPICSLSFLKVSNIILLNWILKLLSLILLMVLVVVYTMLFWMCSCVLPMLSPILFLTFWIPWTKTQKQIRKGQHTPTRNIKFVTFVFFVVVVKAVKIQNHCWADFWFKKPLLMGNLKIRIKKLSILGIFKISKSKNCRFWLFQKPWRTIQFWFEICFETIILVWFVISQTWPTNSTTPNWRTFEHWFQPMFDDYVHFNIWCWYTYWDTSICTY